MNTDLVIRLKLKLSRLTNLIAYLQTPAVRVRKLGKRKSLKFDTDWSYAVFPLKKQKTILSSVPHELSFIQFAVTKEFMMNVAVYFCHHVVRLHSWL